jgi:ATP-dependent exoDNAse (exonuclease V) alpha subunit
MQKISLTGEQADVAEEVCRAAKQGRDLFFDGLAGSGKSTVLAEVARNIPNARLIAPTGKAASVLSRKTGLPTTTVHRLVYPPPSEVIDKKTGIRGTRLYTARARVFAWHRGAWSGSRS